MRETLPLAELVEDTTRTDMRNLPIEQISCEEFERLPKFDRRGVPILDSTDAPIMRSKPRQTRNQAKRQRRE